MSENLVVIGNGIAGITTARHVRKRSNMQITVISAETEYFFSRTALMYVFMGHMRFSDTKPYADDFWQKNRIDLIYGKVEHIATESKTLHLLDGRTIPYDKLVIATGSKSNKFGWPGQELPGVQGLYSWQDLELMEDNTRGISRAVIVGGGLIGIEVAEMLLSRNIPVTFLVREEFYWDNILPKDEARMIGEHVRQHGVDLRLQTNLREILPDEKGRARAVVTDSDEEIACEFVALTPGVHPNIELARNSKIETGHGVLVNDFLETNIDGVYAVGDCAEIVVPGDARNRIEQLWYTGKMQGVALAKTICGERSKYERGIWYNSAKLMDIEYQTYGFVSNLPREGESSFYWEHSGARHSIRIVYDSETEKVLGFNFFGIRMRQDVCQNWIRDGKSLSFVIEHLRTANFDPEFFRRYEWEILTAYNDQYGDSLSLLGKVGLYDRLIGQK